MEDKNGELFSAKKLQLEETKYETWFIVKRRSYLNLRIIVSFWQEYVYRNWETADTGYQIQRIRLDRK